MDQLQFGGTIPFQDRRNGGQVQVRVWGVYVGQGVDAHEQDAIQQWIMNALASSALQYDGDVHELPMKAHEWGSWVSQQIAPGLAQTFQAHGQIQIQGVQIEGAGGAKGMAAGAMHGKPMAQAKPMAPQGKPMAAGGGLIDKAANAISQQLGIPPHQAAQAAQIVMQILEVEGGMSAKGGGGYAKKVDPNVKQAHAGYVEHNPDPNLGKVAAAKHDPYAKQADPYAKKPDYGHGKPDYGKQPDYGHGKPDYGKQPDYGHGKPDYGKQPMKQADPHADEHGKGDPWKK